MFSAQEAAESGSGAALGLDGQGLTPGVVEKGVELRALQSG
jgi:hypothetical protein